MSGLRSSWPVVVVVGLRGGLPKAAAVPEVSPLGVVVVVDAQGCDPTVLVVVAGVLGGRPVVGGTHECRPIAS